MLSDKGYLLGLYRSKSNGEFSFIFICYLLEKCKSLFTESNEKRYLVLFNK